MVIDLLTCKKLSMRPGVIATAVLALALLAGCDLGPNGDQQAQDQQGAAERTAPIGESRTAQAPEQQQPATPPAAPPPAEQPAQAPAQPPAAGGATLQAPPESAVDLAKGEQIYNQFCVACHLTGVAGAPKLGDKELWAPRIAQGRDMMFTHAKNGLRAMPPMGTCVTCSDADLMSAIEFMTGKVE